MALDYSFTFNGLAFGNGTNIQITKADGLEDLPEIRTSDKLRGAADGELVGLDLLAGRSITLELLVLDSGAGDYFTTIEACKSAFTLGASETALVWQLPGRTQRSALSRCRRRSISVNNDYQYRYGVVIVEFHATDPRAYDPLALQATANSYQAGTSGISLSVGTGVDRGVELPTGVGVNLGFDLTGLAGIGAINCINNGSTFTYPVITFGAGSGITGWSITNQTTGVTDTFNTVLGAGQVMVVDMHAAMYGSPTTIPVAINGASSYNAWAAPRSPLALAPGINVVIFLVATGDTANATCQLQWQSAYL